MSLNIKIELTVDTVLAIQDAARGRGEADALEIARDQATRAVVDAVQQLPYDINQKASSCQATAAPPSLKRNPPSSSSSPPPSKSMKYDPGSIHFFVKRLSGEELTIYLPPSSTINDVKGEIEKIEDLPPHMQRLIFQGKQLEDGRTLNYVSSHSANLVVT
jgi:hypothetical protein